MSQTWPLNAQQNVPKFKFGNGRDPPPLPYCDKLLNVALFFAIIPKPARQTASVSLEVPVLAPLGPQEVLILVPNVDDIDVAMNIL